MNSPENPEVVKSRPMALNKDAEELLGDQIASTEALTEAVKELLEGIHELRDEVLVLRESVEENVRATDEHTDALKEAIEDA